MVYYYEVVLPVAVRQTYTYCYDKDDDIFYRRVKVPLGVKDYTGFVISRIDKPDENITYKTIKSVIDKEPLLTDDLAKLYKLILKEQFTYPYIALNTILPPVLKLYKYTARKSYEKEEEIVILNQSILNTKRIIDDLLKKAPAQAIILQILLTYGGEFTRREIVKFSCKGYGVIKELEDKKYIKLVKRKDEVSEVMAPIKRKVGGTKLTADQCKIVNSIKNSLSPIVFNEFLIFGVTGSGKTEVYMAVIDEVLKLGKQAIVLVPEISLTTQIWERFYERYQDKVVLSHSGLSDTHRLSIWRKIKSCEVKIVIGPRSALYAPFNNLGLIVVDEEQSLTYKANENPRINSRDLAIARAKILDIPVILGSATPSVETFYRAQNNQSTLLVLQERINKLDLPEIEIVDMREEFKKRGTQLFSETLKTEIQRVLRSGHQAIIFLNRRGYSRFVRCSNCGYTLKCINCDISLTLHGYGRKLLCHYCGLELQRPQNCPKCNSE
ncbi:MAG: primosomal protein N', partial [Candidatus Hydrogenedentota bacterium]